MPTKVLGKSLKNNFNEAFKATRIIRNHLLQNDLLHKSQHIVNLDSVE